jgi:hypothetical protein
VGGGNELTTVEYLDPKVSTSWSAAPSLNTKRSNLGAVTAPCPTGTDTCIYVFGGFNGVWLASMEYYDPKGSTGWTQIVNSLLVDRASLGAAAAPCPTGTDTCLYAIGGGNDGPSALASVEYDDPRVSSLWATLPAPLNTGREGLGATAAPCPTGTDDCLYAIGGNGNGDLTSAEYYDTGHAAPTLARIGSFTAARRAGIISFRWQAPYSAGIVGFDLYRGNRRLNHHLIPVHTARQYRYQVHDTGPGPFSLSVVLTSGGEERVSLPGT